MFLTEILSWATAKEFMKRERGSWTFLLGIVNAVDED